MKKSGTHAVHSAMPLLGSSFALSWDGRIVERLDSNAVPTDELWITWRPSVIGGAKGETLTGLDTNFPLHSVSLHLQKIKRVGNECRAVYRV